MTIRRILYIIFLQLLSLSCEAQFVDHYYPEIIASTTRLCNDRDTITLTIYTASYQAPINSGHPLNFQNRVFSLNPSACPVANTNNYIAITEVDPQVTGDGVISVSRINSGTLCNPSYSLVIKAKPANSTVYHIYWGKKNTYYNFPGTPNGAWDSSYYDNSIAVDVVHLGRPSISANRVLIFPTETATLTATGCGSPAIYLWKNSCANSSWSASGSTLAAGIGTYTVRCTQSGCIGEPSNEISIIRETPAPIELGCQDLTATGIYMNTMTGNDGTPDYHQYSVLTKICSTTGNSACTMESVWQKMKSDVWNTAPASGDFAAISIGKIQPVFSDMLFVGLPKPVVNCGNASLPLSVSNITNLPARAAVSTSLYMMAKHGVPYTDAINAYIQNYIQYPQSGNPIMQTIDEATHSVSNYTLSGHILYPGRIVRTVVEECGEIKIRTVGVGHSWAFNYTPIGLAMGVSMGYLNKKMGEQLFKQVDLRIKAQY